MFVVPVGGGFAVACFLIGGVLMVFFMINNAIRDALSRSRHKRAEAWYAVRADMARERRGLPPLKK